MVLNHQRGRPWQADPVDIHKSDIVFCLIISASFFTFTYLFDCFAYQLAVIPLPFSNLTAIGLLGMLHWDCLNCPSLGINIDNSFIDCRCIPCRLVFLVPGITGQSTDDSAYPGAKQSGFAVSANCLTKECSQAAANYCTFLGIIAVVGYCSAGNQGFELW